MSRLRACSLNTVLVKLGMLRRIRKNISMRTTSTTCNSFILPALNYWDTAQKLLREC